MAIIDKSARRKAKKYLVKTYKKERMITERDILRLSILYNIHAKEAIELKKKAIKELKDKEKKGKSNLKRS